MLKASIVDLDIYDPNVNLRLDERGLAEQLGISRTPIREAIMRLEQEGFVTTLPRRGVYIKRKNLEEILEMVVVWAALESMAARLACVEATDEEIARLRAIGTRYTTEKAKAKISEYSEANIEFHLCILQISKCRMLEEMAERLFTHLKAVRRRALTDETRADRSVVDHTEIIEAIEARDADRAGRLVRDHTMRLHNYIRRTWIHIAGEAEAEAATASSAAARNGSDSAAH
ncbi:GntR family transcriptional regulator [Paralimibaculum aggregatum]|uniref:GntR family transcriptional regulator n=1 Tax=Paralimibaculum aggregatum TaxID=3036245 RepID=A0ABQ6LT99_9RHOB|nr:GntR family transcriptional regulator [Limibaculum sp. NKW23]